MGIGGHIVDAIAREHAYRPISGTVLLIGRQTTYFTPDDLLARLREHGHHPDPAAIEIDKSTINRLAAYGTSELVTDRSIFHSLGIDNVLALDVSDYEGAEILHNLNEPLPDHLKGITDFVIDGSTLDNTFNPALTLRNYAELLRPNGRFIAVNSYGVYETAYAIMPPMWYVDYFVENKFRDCKAYVSMFDDGRTNTFFVNLDYLKDHRQNMSRLPSPYQNSCIIFAEKGENSTSATIPTQQHYRSKEEWDIYLENLSEILSLGRPHVARSYSDQFFREMDGSYTWIDRQYLAGS